MFLEQMKKEQQSVETRIARIEEKLKQMPEGKLICAKNGTQYKWYRADKGTKIYLPKSEKETAVELAQKRVFTTFLEELKCEQKAINSFWSSYHCKIKKIDKQYMEDEEFRRLVAMPKQNDLQEWQKEPYERNPKHPEHLNHKSYWGEIFRSKSEMMIAGCLRERGIPYRYECALKLAEGTFYPDFTIMHPKTGRIYYYEHYGKMDDPKYINDNMPKLSIYAKNGIVPGVDLILSFETQKEPLGMYTIDCLLSQYFS